LIVALSIDLFSERGDMTNTSYGLKDRSWIPTISGLQSLPLFACAETLFDDGNFLLKMRAGMSPTDLPRSPLAFHGNLYIAKLARRCRWPLRGAGISYCFLQKPEAARNRKAW
jgi:hypothetical protein